MEMVLIGSEATIKVVTEYNVRFLLQPKQYIKGRIILSSICITETKCPITALCPVPFCD